MMDRIDEIAERLAEIRYQLDSPNDDETRYELRGERAELIDELNKLKNRSHEQQEGDQMNPRISELQNRVREIDAELHPIVSDLSGNSEEVAARTRRIDALVIEKRKIETEISALDLAERRVAQATERRLQEEEAKNA
jgi:chromosome segregation ATPase